MQTATLRAQDEAQEAKHYMHLYEKLKNELRTKDAFEAYQLIEILQVRFFLYHSQCIKILGGNW